MMTNYLDFEKPLAEIEGKAEELRALARSNKEMDIGKEAEALAAQLANGFQLPMDPIHLKIGGIDLVQELVDMIHNMMEA